MRIRFNKELALCRYDGKGFFVVLKAFDQDDFKAWSRTRQDGIPKHAFVMNERGSIELDWTKLTEDEAIAVMFGDSRFVASRVVETNISFAIDDQPDVEWGQLDEEQKTITIHGLREADLDFNLWVSQYLKGMEKKSRRMDIVE